MNKQTIILGLMAILLLSIANAEIYVSANSILNEQENTFTRIAYISYPNDETFIGKNVRFALRLGCEDIGDFNTANPTYAVNNVSVRTIYTKADITNVSFNEYSSQYYYISGDADYGCDSTSSCTSGNTPVTDKFIEYNFLKGEHLTIQLVTYFANNVIDDSPCSVGIDFDSQNCRGCGDLNFEQVTQQLDTRQNNFQKKSGILSATNELVNMNYSIWLYSSYIIKIGVVLGVIFALVWLIMWAYHFFRFDLGKQ